MPRLPNVKVLFRLIHAANFIELANDQLGYTFVYQCCQNATGATSQILGQVFVSSSNVPGPYTFTVVGTNAANFTISSAGVLSGPTTPALLAATTFTVVVTATGATDSALVTIVPSKLHIRIKLQTKLFVYEPAARFGQSIYANFF